MDEQVGSAELNRGRLGWPTVAALGISIVIAGQFSGWNYGLAAGGWAGMFAASLLVLVLYVGLSLCVAELSSAMPDAGGLYTYAQAAFGPFVGYLVGLAIFIALAIGSGAATEFISAYTHSVMGIGGWAVKLPLFLVIIAIHLRGVGEALGLTFAIGAVAVLTIVLFCAAMVPFFRIENLSTAGAPLALDLNGIFASIPFAVWLFLGVEQAATASEEARNPASTMPKGLLAAIAVLFITATGVLLLAPGAGGAERVGAADDPLYAAISSPSAYREGAWLAQVVGAGALLGLIATFFSLIYSSSRQLFALARNGYFPASVARVGRRGTPYVALIVVGMIGIPASLMPPSKILVIVVLLLSASYIVVLAAFIHMRITRPTLPRPFRAHGGKVTAGVSMALSSIVLAACFQLDRVILLSLSGCLVVGAISYFGNRGRVLEATHAGSGRDTRKT